MSPSSLAQAQQFRIVLPRATHWEAAPCADVRCQQYERGWATVVPTVSPQADYIRHDSGRRFTETAQGAGMTEFQFEQGQQCFRQHIAQNGRPALFLKATVTGSQQFQPVDWRDTMAEDLYKLDRLRQRGD